jgi:HSP20 family protein
MTEHRTITVPAARQDVQDIFSSFQREVDRLFDDFGRGVGVLGRSRVAPRVDLCESDTEIEITAELPGLTERDVDVSLVDNLLTIAGEKKFDTARKTKDYAFAERHYGGFSRTVPLPLGVDPAAIKATLANGLLKVTVTKPATAAPTKIEVKPKV